MIRLAIKKDIETLCNLRVLQQKEDWGNEYRSNDEELHKATKKFLLRHLNKDFIMFLNVIDNKIVSTCGLKIVDYLPDTNNLLGLEGYICNVFTLKEYRRRGLQKELLEEVKIYALKNKIKELYLSSDNNKAIDLYQKMGFIHDEIMMRTFF